jgi:hypothetical protein
MGAFRDSIIVTLLSLLVQNMEWYLDDENNVMTFFCYEKYFKNVMTFFCL